MFQRSARTILTRFAQIYPVIGITGPRQSGKSTLAKTLFPHLPYISFETASNRMQAQADFNAFLEKYKSGCIFDEIQELPELLSYLQGVVDADRDVMGRFVITGSQNFTLNEEIGQSLAGRIGMLTLLPLSMAELDLPLSINQRILTGGYPALHKYNMLPEEFFPSYIDAYLERDIRNLRQIDDLPKFQQFIKLCAGRIGKPVDAKDIATQVGVSHTTINRWIDVLETSYLIFKLQPYHENFNQRIVKSPKIYFYDIGIAAFLLGISSDAQLETHYKRGDLFENLAILEILKARRNKGLPASMYFWCKSPGREVDVIGEWGGVLQAIEIKLNSTFNTDYLKGLNDFRKICPRPIKSYVVYTGQERIQVQETEILPIAAVGKVVEG